MSVLLVSWMVASLGCPGQAGAQPPAPQVHPKVKVTVVVILASERCEFIDPRLKAVADEVNKCNPNLKGFSMVSMTQMSLAVNEKATFSCVEDSSVDVVIRQCADKNNKVCLAVTPPLQNEVVYRAICGKFLLIVTRYQTRDRVPAMYVAVALGQASGGGPMGPMLAVETLLAGRCRDRLILAIRVQPCNGK
jgi:hypothetical protein